jgi:hypothetical protein
MRVSTLRRLLDQEGLDVDGFREMLISRQREEVEDDGGSSTLSDEEYFRGTASIDGSGNPINKKSCFVSWVDHVDEGGDSRPHYLLEDLGSFVR